MTIIIPWPYLWFSKNQSGTFFSVYGRRATASSHISCDLKWSGIILNDHGWLHMHCNITHLLRQETIRDRLQYPWTFFNGFSTHLLSFKDKRSNTSSEVIKIMPVSMGTASSHISWILKWSRTNLKFDRLWATASLHISCVFKWPGTYFNDHGFMPTALLHISGVLKWSGTNLRFDGLWATASLHIFWTPGIYCSKLCNEAHDRSLRSVYGTFSLRMRSSRAYFL